MPNSQWAIVSMHPNNQPEGLWVIDVQSGRKALLVAGREFGQPAVSPSAGRVAVGVGVEAQLPGAGKHPPVGIAIIDLPSMQQLGASLH